MALDATGAATSPDAIPTYNTAVDAPSGKGLNAIVAAIQTALSARVSAPAGIASGEAVIWNGTTWVRSSVTKLGVGSVAPSGANGDVLTTVAGAAAWAAPTSTGLSVLDRVTTLVDVNTSIVETNLYNFAVPGNTLSTNKMLELVLLGNYLHNNANVDTATIRVKFGGTTFWSQVVQPGATINANRHPWELRLNVAELGTTNSQLIQGFLLMDPATSAAPTAGIGNANVSPLGTPIGIFTMGTIDTTASQNLTVTVQWSVSSANDSWQMRYASLRLA